MAKTNRRHSARLGRAPSLNVASVDCRAVTAMQRETVMSGRINNEIEECIRNNVTWQALPRHLQQVRSGVKAARAVCAVSAIDVASARRFVFVFRVFPIGRFNDSVVGSWFCTEFSPFDVFPSMQRLFRPIAEFHMALIILDK